MFIKLTRIDGTPIWLNAAFVVTVEPTRNGGTVVVPMGDGLDYEVQEKPEEVLSFLEGSANSIPAAVKDVLKCKTKERVSALENQDTTQSQDQTTAPNAKKPKTVKKRLDDEEKVIQSEGKSITKKGVKGKTRLRKLALDLSGKELERLERMAPRSMKRLLNTLSSQFKEKDADKIVQALLEHNIIALDQGHIKWSLSEEKPELL